jgi:hypothetical protein
MFFSGSSFSSRNERPAAVRDGRGQGVRVPGEQPLHSQGHCSQKLLTHQVH